MKVWVIMGNDYPAAVCGSEASANEAVAFFKKKTKETSNSPDFNLIHWCHSVFELDTLEN